MIKSKSALTSTTSTTSTIFIVFLITFILIILICFSSDVNAAIIKGNPFFNLTQTSYGPNQVLEGFLNFSLKNEQGSTKVSASVMQTKKEMLLLDFLKKANVNFNCNPSDCKTSYDVSSPATEKSTFCDSGSEKYFALVISGRKNIEIKNLSFWLDGLSYEDMTCGETPLKLDLLDDNTIEWEYKEASVWCTAFYSSDCLTPSLATEDSILSSIPYCEKIKINKTGSIELAAYLKLEQLGTNGYEDIELFITDSNGIKKGSCDDINVYNEIYELKSCVIDSISEPGFYIGKADDYFICVRQKAGTSKYAIKSEAAQPVCGFYGQPPKSFSSDYALYVRTAGFAPFESDVFDETNFIGNNLQSYLQNYIITKYNKDCSEKCILPLKFISIAKQQLNLSNLYFEFSTDSGDLIIRNFYNLEVKWPLLNMSMQPVSFSALNATTSEAEAGQYTVTARLGAFTENKNFKIESVPSIQSVSPLSVIPNTETKFYVIATAPLGRNIVKYEWNFGDGTSEIITTAPNVTHIYSQIKEYTLAVKATDNLGLTGSRSFVITSNITKELLNETIELLVSQLNDFSLQYNSLEPWWRDMLKVNITTTNAILISLKQQIPTATQSQLFQIKKQLDSPDLEIPISISDSFVLHESLFYPDPEKINPSYIDDYDSDYETQFKHAIALWQQDNLNLYISGKIKTLTFRDKVKEFTLMNIKLDPQESVSNAYVVFYLPSGISYGDIKFKNTDLTISDLSDAISFEFYNLDTIETISFALPGKHLDEIMFYASPTLGELQVIPPITKEKKIPYALVVFLIIIIIIAILAALFFIWRGYEKKLEKKLFKSPADLRNLMSFISMNLISGLPNKKIKEKLIKAGWTKGQVDYAFKKLKKQKKKKKAKKKKEKGIRIKQPDESYRRFLRFRR